MMVLMFSGFGNQPLFLDSLDIGLATFFNVMMWFQYKRLLESGYLMDALDEEPEHIDTRKQIKWFILYTLLILVLVGTMLLQIPYLPEAIQPK